MTQFKMNIDLELLKKQIDDLSKILAHTSYAIRESDSLEGVINLLGTIRDQVEPPPVEYRPVWNNLVVCLRCGVEHFERDRCNCLKDNEGGCEECQDVDTERLKKAGEPHIHNTGCHPKCDMV